MCRKERPKKARKGSTYEETSTNTGVRATEAELLTDLDQTGDGTLTGETGGLVDLAQHSVSGLGNDGGGETSNETRSEVDTGDSTVRESGLVDAAEDLLSNLLEDDELGHGVGDPEDTFSILFSFMHDICSAQGATYCLKRMGPNPE